MTSPDSEGTLDKMGVIENRIRLANLYCLYNSRHFYAPHHTSYMLERAHGDFLPTLTGCSQIQRLRPRRYSSMTFPAGSHPTNATYPCAAMTCPIGEHSSSRS